MQTYIIEQDEVCWERWRYFVDAESLEQAIHKLRAGDFDCTRSYIQEWLSEGDSGRELVSVYDIDGVKLRDFLQEDE